ncbi:MAG: flagellar protein FliT [Rhodanobacter sp.]
MSAVECGPLEQAFRMGKQMLDAAQQQQWDDVTRMHSDYEALLEQNQATPVTPATHDSLLQVWLQHQQLLELTSTARDAVARELDRNRHNHRALNTYLVHSPED